MTIDDLRELKELIMSKGLWSFMGQFEKEKMVGTTIIACVVNHDKHGEMFSFKGNNLMGGDNGAAYRFLLDQDYLIETERQGETVIKPTEKLIAALKEYYKLAA